MYGVGLISRRRMGEFDALFHLELHEMPPQKIKALREKAHVCQAIFTAERNTSLSSVQKWEAGDKKPGGPSLKLLTMVERKGLEILL